MIFRREGAVGMDLDWGVTEENKLDRPDGFDAAVEMLDDGWGVGICCLENERFEGDSGFDSRLDFEKVSGKDSS